MQRRRPVTHEAEGDAANRTGWLDVIDFIPNEEDGQMVRCERLGSLLDDSYRETA
jgi:hypothetical protein